MNTLHNDKESAVREFLGRLNTERFDEGGERAFCKAYRLLGSALSGNVLARTWRALPQKQRCDAGGCPRMFIDGKTSIRYPLSKSVFEQMGLERLCRHNERQQERMSGSLLW